MIEFVPVSRTGAIVEQHLKGKVTYHEENTERYKKKGEIFKDRELRSNAAEARKRSARQAASHEEVGNDEEEKKDES